MEAVGNKGQKFFSFWLDYHLSLNPDKSLTLEKCRLLSLLRLVD